MQATALIILNYNNAAATADCLRSVRTYNSARKKTVVVEIGRASCRERV